MATAKKKATPKRAPPKPKKKTPPAKSAAPAAKRKPAGARPRKAAPEVEPAKIGRPPAVSDEELLAALLADPSPSNVAARLGIHRNTVTNRLKAPAIRNALADYRRESMAVVGVKLVDATAAAVDTLVELAKDSNPQDSVRLGAASAILRLAKELGKGDAEQDKPDDTWESAPKWVPRLVENNGEPTEGGGGSGVA